MQYEFIMHFMVPEEFSMSAQSTRAILIKYVLIVHSALVSFSLFSHKTHCYCFRMKIFWTCTCQGKHCSLQFHQSAMKTMRERAESSVTMEFLILVRASITGAYHLLFVCRLLQVCRFVFFSFGYFFVLVSISQPVILLLFSYLLRFF